MNSIKIVKAPNISDPEIRRLQLVGLVIPLHERVENANTVTVLIKDVLKVLKEERKFSAVEYWSAVGKESMTFKSGEYIFIS